MGDFLKQLSCLLIIFTLYLIGLYTLYSIGFYDTIGKGIVIIYTRTGVFIQEFFKDKTEKPYKQNIANVIKRDKVFADQIKFSEICSSNLSDNEKLNEYARRISNYVQRAKKGLNFDEIPSDFVSAYISHLNACGQKAQEVANHPNMDPWNAFFEGFFRGLCGDFTGGAFEKEAIHNEWIARLKQHEDDINSTWDDVESVSAKYGVNVSNCH